MLTFSQTLIVMLSLHFTARLEVSCRPTFTQSTNRAPRRLPNALSIFGRRLSPQLQQKWGATPANAQRHIVSGGGPVGLYAAYRLLSLKKTTHVTLVESRAPVRPQVIRIPFSIAKRLPESIKLKMWPQPAYDRVFHKPACSPSLWPRIGYERWPFINIATFQTEMLNYLLETFPLRFTHDISAIEIKKEAKDAFERFVAGDNGKISSIFCTCGYAATSLREKMRLDSGKPAERKGPGIYWIYRIPHSESYCRNGKPISPAELGALGVTYAASNNQNGDVQLYTYPVGPLEQIYASMPSNFGDYASFGAKSQTLTAGENPHLPANVAQLFQNYVSAVQEIISKTDVRVPQNLSEIKVYYAPRSEYYFDRVTAEVDIGGQNTPLFFLGDSAGSTDYKLGLSGGRGLLAAEETVKALVDKKKNAAEQYQRYWENVVREEFNQPPTLTATPYIQFHYMAKGRRPYFTNKDYPSFERKYYLKNPKT